MRQPLNTNKKTPYANLDPHLILDAVEQAGFACSGGLFALNSFENRVYQIGIEDSAPVIAKFYRPERWTDAAILEEHQFALELHEHEIPVVAPLVSATGETLHHHKGFSFALFPRQGGRALELDNLEHLEWMGRFIGRLHAVSACKAFKHRLELNVKTYGENSYRFLLDNDFFPAPLKAEFCTTIEALLKKVTERFQECGKLNTIRLHGDCHVGNVLWNDSGPRIVDLDDCLMGPAVQDIWMLVSGNTEAQVNIQLDAILEGYQDFHDFNYAELRLIEALRTLRMIQYCCWVAKRWDDPAFPLNFPWFNTFPYWQMLLDDLQEQAMLLDKVPFESE
jgi:Ser/Thr protein kinase RdoA (MazF antagonist)